MARVLMVGGGCRGRGLARELARDGHVLRITTRGEAGRAAIEAAGAECWIGTPDRIGTLRGALDAVTIACWLLGTASGAEETLEALHGTRLELWLSQMIDTTVRGFVYEPPQGGAEGERLVLRACRLSSIPVSILRADPREEEAWRAAARDAVEGLLGPPGGAMLSPEYPESRSDL